VWGRRVGAPLLPRVGKEGWGAAAAAGMESGLGRRAAARGEGGCGAAVTEGGGLGRGEPRGGSGMKKQRAAGEITRQVRGISGSEYARNRRSARWTSRAPSHRTACSTIGDRRAGRRRQGVNQVLRQPFWPQHSIGLERVDAGIAGSRGVSSPPAMGAAVEVT
jgi:hypothetical protein